MKTSALTTTTATVVLILTIFCVNRVQSQLPVNPPGPDGPPQAPAAEVNYEAPVLQGGLGTVSDGKEDPKRRRYPDRSGSYSQAYDPGLAFRYDTFLNILFNLSLILSQLPNRYIVGDR